MLLGTGLIRIRYFDPKRLLSPRFAPESFKSLNIRAAIFAIAFKIQTIATCLKIKLTLAHNHRSEMNQRDILLMSLRRQDLDYQMRAREALVHVEDALRKKDLQVRR